MRFARVEARRAERRRTRGIDRDGTRRPGRAADRAALTQVLAGVEVAEPELSWIPSVGMMVMGFILPFALTFVAIPLESFIHSSRTVLGLVMVWLLHAISFSIRLMANVIHGAGRFFVNMYDLVILV